MSVIKIIDGVKIEMYAKEEGHNKPHVHIKYSGQSCSVNIETGEIIRGNIQSNKLEKVLDWIEENKNELIEMYFSKEFHKF